MKSKMMRQRSRWKTVFNPGFCWMIVIFWTVNLAATEDDKRRNAPNSVFSPRMDYNQWKPLGRGDPLQNDPTFDYVPPVLDQVQYWMNSDKENKGDILVLGVASKKPAITATDRHDTNSFFSNQRVARPNNFFPSMTSQVIPSIMNLANQVLDRFSKGPERMPYTVLMPPQKDFVAFPTSPMTQRPFTPSQPYLKPAGVTVQESNLIYQSTSVGNQKDFESVPSINWELQSTTESLNYQYRPKLELPNSFMRVPFGPKNSNKILEASGSNQNINYVTPPPLDDSKLTFRGQVSDDNDISDSYVKIEKPQAQVAHQMLQMFDYPQPLSMQTIKEMETMKPPPVTQSPIYPKPTNPILNALSNEEVSTTQLPETTTDFEESTTTRTLTTDPFFKHYKQPIEPIRGPLYLIIQGHSKVKTYKPAKQIDGIPVQETNEISDQSVYGIKHLHGHQIKEDLLEKAETLSKQRQARTGNLMTLKHVVQTGLGAIEFEKKEAELEAGYDVVEGFTTEKYLKGIVEQARKLA